MPGVDFWLNAEGAKTGADQWTAALLRIDRSAQETALHLEKMANQGAIAGARVGGGLKQAFPAILGMVTGVGSLAAVVVKTISSFDKFIDKADHFNDLSERFKIPVSTLSALSSEANQAGANIDEVARSMQALANAQRAALNDVKGTGEAAQAFADIGVSFKDAQGGATQLLPLLVEVAKGLTDAGEAAAGIAPKLTGRGGGELLPFFRQLASSKDILTRQGAITDDAAHAADRFKDSMNRLSDSWERGLTTLKPLVDKMSDFFDVIANPPAQVHPPDPKLTPIGIFVHQQLLAANNAEEQAKAALAFAQKQAAEGPVPPELAAAREANRRADIERQLAESHGGFGTQEAIDAAKKQDEAFNKLIETEKRLTPPEVIEAQRRLTEALRDRADAAKDLASVRDAGAEVVTKAKPLPSALDAASQNFIDKLKAQGDVLRTTGFATDEFKIRQDALAVSLTLTAEQAKTFARELDAGLSHLRDNTAIATATTTLDSLGDAFDKVGKTDAEVRMIEFNKQLALIGSHNTDVALLADLVRKLNKELERRIDQDVFDKRLKAMQEEIPLILIAINAREQEQAVLELMRATQDRATEGQREAIRAVVAHRQELERLQHAADDAANAITQGFEDAILRTSSLTDLVRNLGLELSRIGLRTFLQPATSALSGFFASAFGAASAHGNAFSGGRLLEFARGGIVDRPTFFPMARGAGLMGEAGPEAVMPLRHGPGGLSIRSDALGGLLPIGRVGGDLGVTLFGRGGLVPSGSLRGGSGFGGDVTTINLVQNVTIRGGSDAAGARQSAKQMAGDFRRALDRSAI